MRALLAFGRMKMRIGVLELPWSVKIDQNSLRKIREGE